MHIERIGNLSLPLPPTPIREELLNEKNLIKINFFYTGNQENALT